MKHRFLKVMIYCNLVVLPYSLLNSGGPASAEESTQDKANVNELKGTIQKQEETIKQLQAEIKKLQDNITEITAPPDPVAKALRIHWTSCGKRNINVSDGLVKVTFISYQDLVHFFDTGAEKHAREDLAVFLNAANLKKGTMEYYNGGMKLFSITGSPTDAKTKKYY